MNNRFIKHFLVIGGGTFISMIIGFLTTPIITRIVNPIEYGQYSIFTMYSNMALMVLCLGLDQAMVRFLRTGNTRIPAWIVVEMPKISNLWSIDCLSIGNGFVNDWSDTI